MSNVNYTSEELEAWEEYVVKMQNKQVFSIGKAMPLMHDAPKRRVFIEGYRAGKEKGKKDGKLQGKA